MAKLTLQDIVSWFNAGPTITENNRLIEEAIENTISRDGASPNDMEANLDLGGYRIINLAAPVEDSDAARKIDLAEVAQIVELDWDNVTNKPEVITDIEDDFPGTLAALGYVPEAAVVAVSGTSLNASTSNYGQYTRFSNLTATYTFSGTAGLVAGREYHGRYVGSGQLTIVASNGMTINAPSEGSLIIPPSGTFTVKIVSATEADLFGVTV